MKIFETLIGSFNKKNQIKHIFDKSFPGENWHSATPYIGDDLIYMEDNGTIIAFCMVHEKPPYEFYKPGFYMYNLCVLPEERNRGVGSMLVDHMKERYKILHLHHDINNSNEQWLIKRGFAPGNTIRLKYKEFTYPSNASDSNVEKTTNQPISENYDNNGNFFYLN